jgi:hypothetical protein
MIANVFLGRLAFADHCTENVGIAAIIVAELKFHNVRRQIFLQQAANAAAGE